VSDPRAAARDGDALALRDVTLRRGGVPVLAGMTLRLAPGEFVALVGPSGCGKSSLLDLAAGLLEADAGTVEVAGGGRRLGRLALMPQGDSLLPWATVRENVEVGARLAGGDRAVTRRDALAQLARVGLASHAEHYPHVLSGGMRQRVALARTVLSGRPVWLLDEPFAALDALTRADLHGDLERLWRRDRPAVLMVTHDTEEAVRLADRVVVAGPRPMGRLVEVPVPLPRPRTTTELAPLRAEVLDVLTGLSRAAAVEGGAR